MEKVDLPDMEKGLWKISKFNVDSMDFRSMMQGRDVPKGTYTRLNRGSTLVMSDTPAEQRDHSNAVFHAKGSCLINGLGIGMVLKNILLKPQVTDVTVVEISQDLIDLVSPFYTDPRVTFVCSDAFKYKIPKDKHYDMVWHDIWDDICGDNIPEMDRLQRKYSKRTDWQGSWARHLCLRYRGW